MSDGYLDELKKNSQLEVRECVFDDGMGDPFPIEVYDYGEGTDIVRIEVGGTRPERRARTARLRRAGVVV